MAKVTKRVSQWVTPPQHYKPEFAQQLLEYMREGFSVTAAAGKMGVWREMLYTWAGKHPEMAEAMKAGKAARVAFLEEGLLKYGGNKDGGKITARIFALKNAAPEEWCEESRVEVGGSIGVDVVVRIVKPVHQLNAEDLKLVE